MENEEAARKTEGDASGHEQVGPLGSSGGQSPFPLALVSQYASQRPVLEKALVEVRTIAVRQIGKLKDRHLVRATVAEDRVKDLASLWAKARRNGWAPEEALSRAEDAIGMRIVCNNLEDVPRAKDLLLEAPELRLVDGSLQDYLACPKDTGYRAMHFLVTYAVVPQEGAAETAVKCEIQIRTYLADAWARLSHQDFYKEGAGIPPHLERLFRHLADLLKVADDIAQDIREEVSRPKVPTGEPPAEGIELDSLAFIYRRKFFEPPPEYLLRITADRCREVGVTRLDALDRKLADNDLLDAIWKVYGDEHGIEFVVQELFELLPTAVAFGDPAAIDLAKQRAQAAWEEVDAHYRSGVKAEWLPETLDEFMKSLNARDPRDPDWPAEMVYDLAHVFGTTASCIICGAAVVQTDALAEAIAEHYGEPDRMDEIEPELFGSGVETGYDRSTTYCNHCGYMLNKDD